jgi:hypothetical protein
MNEAQTAILEDEDVNELDWRVYAPRTRHLTIYICNAEWQTDTPRLWLMDGDEEDSPDRDLLRITIDSETFWAKSWQRWGGPAARAGTWNRYRQDIAWVKEAIRSLGWTLTGEERALVAALEDYARQAPARCVTAA